MIAAKFLSDPSPELQNALIRFLVKSDSGFDLSRFNSLLFEASTNPEYDISKLADILTVVLKRQDGDQILEGLSDGIALVITNLAGSLRRSIENILNERILLTILDDLRQSDRSINYRFNYERFVFVLEKNGINREHLDRIYRMLFNPALSNAVIFQRLIRFFEKVSRNIIPTFNLLNFNFIST